MQNGFEVELLTTWCRLQRDKSCNHQLLVVPGLGAPLGFGGGLESWCFGRLECVCIHLCMPSFMMGGTDLALHFYFLWEPK